MEVCAKVNSLISDCSSAVCLGKLVCYPQLVMAAKTHNLGLVLTAVKYWHSTAILTNKSQVLLVTQILSFFLLNSFIAYGQIRV